MSYINCYDNNYYVPSEGLRDLFVNLVVQPLEHGLPEIATDFREIRIPKLNYQREVILEQGRADFDVPFEDFDVPFEDCDGLFLSQKEKVLLYCAHYMPMHLFSSYHIFKNRLSSRSSNIVFIDFGCGPLTSGTAFWAAARQHNITYIGIDSSLTMRDKAREINQHGPYGPDRSSESFYKDDQLHLIPDYNQLPGLLGRIEMGNLNATLIIFNFCYFLASKSLNIGDLSNVLIQIVERYSQHKMYVVHQNPTSSRLNENWKKLKDELAAFRFKSQTLKPNGEFFRYNQLINDKLHNPKVYYDILCAVPIIDIPF